MGGFLIVDPGPVRSAPEMAIVVSAFAHKLEKLSVRALICANREGRNCDGMLFKLVVPAKDIPAARNSKRGKSCRDLDDPGVDGWRGSMKNYIAITARHNLPIWSQLVQHIRQGLRMH